ncbi:MAG: hypothetical protein ACRDZ8_11615 [Acidimicrobiales bacterium]
MPWCETCSKFWSPPAMGKDGECPTCGEVIAQPRKAPWHFKLLLGGLVIYLGYRAYQGVEWLAHRL